MFLAEYRHCLFPAEYRHCLCFRVLLHQAQHAHAVFYTQERSQTTQSTVFEHMHHKDRRRLQLFQRLALRQGRASFCDICQHILAASHCGAFCHTMEQRRHGRWRSHGSTVAQPLRLYCQPLQQLHCHFVSVCSCVTLPSSPSCSGWASLVSSVKTRHISRSSVSGKASEQGVCVQKVAGASPDRWDHGAPTGQRGPPVEAIMCLFTLPSQDQPLEHKWTLPSSMTTTSPSCLSMRCRSLRMRAKKASLVSFCQDDLLKTRSVKTHFTMLVSVTHSMSTSPVPVIEYVAPASVVFYAVIEHSALQRSGHEHEHTWKRRKKIR